ncbi:class A beta-lactamase [Nocardia sp. NPDC052566]|uniref:class A beta-lactamase n=1 Tax=Nocardia sp. NPDC052566 TaxID=3364330 RepID=UPI0037C9E48F
MFHLTGGSRSAIAAMLALPFLAACDPGATVVQGVPAKSARPTEQHAARFADLEKRYNARIGVLAVDTMTGATVTNRADERFPMLSTFTPLLAAWILSVYDLHSGDADRVIHYTEADVVDHSPVASTRVAEGMTIAQLAEAAITQNDHTAGNLLLRMILEPQNFTEHLRSIGDHQSRLDRWAPDLNTAIPGDERDTTTPAALAADYRRVFLEIRPADWPEQQLLISWLKANRVGDKRIRAGVPAGWTTGGKTDTGSYGCANDAAITWPGDGRPPLVIAVQTCKSAEDAQVDNAVFAEAAKIVIDSLSSSSR